MAVRDEQKLFRAGADRLQQAAGGQQLVEALLDLHEAGRSASAMMRTPMHPGGEGPDGPIPPIWSEPNWQGSGRHG
jgi:hypothetical protein